MEKQIDFNGEWSDAYDDTAKKIIPAYSAIYELTQHLLRSVLDRNANILVAGAGTGKEIIDCARQNPHWSFTGFDPAEPMLTIARQKVALASLENRVSFVQGKVEDVAGKDFDAATAILIMHFLPDDGEKQHFLRSLAKKLKPGAPVIVVDLEGEIGSPEYQILNGAWRDLQFFARKDAEKVEEEFSMREKEVHFIPGERIKSLLAEAGFVQVHRFFKAYLFGGYIAINGTQTDSFLH